MPILLKTLYGVEIGFSILEVSELLGVDRLQIYRRIKNGSIPHYAWTRLRRGGKWLRETEVKKLLDSQGIKPPAATPAPLIKSGLARLLKD
jgi:excisionase family DNA binding protein